jgi:hypothetical protein
MAEKSWFGKTGRMELFSTHTKIPGTCFQLNVCGQSAKLSIRESQQFKPGHKNG